MFTASAFAAGLLQGEPGKRKTVLMSGSGKTVATALIRLIDEARGTETTGAAGVDIVEPDGFVAMTAYGATVAEAIEEAKAMHNKARRGGGR